MMKKLLLLTTFVTSLSFATPGPFTPAVNKRFLDLELGYNASGDGSYPMKTAIVEINYANHTALLYDKVYNWDIPANAIIMNCFYEVTQTFTSENSDAGKISLSVMASGDVVADTAISTGTTWDATEKPVKGVPDWATANDAIKMGPTALGLIVHVSVATLTAGNMIVYCQYVEGE